MTNTFIYTYDKIMPIKRIKKFGKLKKMYYICRKDYAKEKDY